MKGANLEIERQRLDDEGVVACHGIQRQTRDQLAGFGVRVQASIQS